MGIVVVNSTVNARRKMATDGAICPIHYWGYQHGGSDTLIGHRFNRWEIVLRSKIGGLDPRVVLQTVRALRSGAIGTYCVTQPDLLRAVPLLKRWFPHKPVVTWVWTREEAHGWFKLLKHADLILSLTDDALIALDQLGLATKSALGMWGAPPGFFDQSATGSDPAHDVMFFGLANRDTALVRELAHGREFSILTTRKAEPHLDLASIPGHRVTVSSADKDREMVAAIHTARVALIPLKPGDLYPTGMTNLVEALLCGTSVVIPAASLIPAAALGLPGVQRYVAGDLQSFVAAIRAAVDDNRKPDRRSEIRRAAAKILNGAELNRRICSAFGMQPQDFWRTDAVPAADQARP